MLLSIPDEEEEELNLDDQDEQGNLKGFINDDDDEEEEEEGSDSGDSEDDVGHKKRKRSKFCDMVYCWQKALVCMSWVICTLLGLVYSQIRKEKL